MTPKASLELECVYKCKINVREPVLPLQCMHFICSADSCRAKFEESGRVCSLCQIEVQPLERKIIPEQIFIKEAEKSLESVHLECDVCIRNLPAVAYCQSCAGCICEKCKDNHLYNKKLQKNHQLTTDLSEAKARKLEKLKQADLKCNLHDQDFTEYCERCGDKLCEGCLPCHEGHARSRINTVITVLKTDVSIGKNVVQKLNEAVQAIEIEQDKMEDGQNSFLIKIDKEHDELIRKLVESKVRRKTEAREIFSREMEALTSKKVDAEYSKAVTERFISLAEATLNEGTAVSSIKFVRAYQGVINDMVSMHHQMITRMDTGKDLRPSVLCDLSAKPCILKLIDNFGVVNCLNDSQPNVTCKCEVLMDDTSNPEDAGDEAHFDFVDGMMDEWMDYPVLEEEVVPKIVRVQSLTVEGIQLEMDRPFQPLNAMDQDNEEATSFCNEASCSKTTENSRGKISRGKPGDAIRSKRVRKPKHYPGFVPSTRWKPFKPTPQKKRKRRVARNKRDYQSGTSANPNAGSTEGQVCSPGISPGTPGESCRNTMSDDLPTNTTRFSRVRDLFKDTKHDYFQ